MRVAEPLLPTPLRPLPPGVILSAAAAVLGLKASGWAKIDCIVALAMAAFAAAVQSQGESDLLHEHAIAAVDPSRADEAASNPNELHQSEVVARTHGRIECCCRFRDAERPPRKGRAALD
jgi:hypothetical protein